MEDRTHSQDCKLLQEVIDAVKQMLESAEVGYQFCREELIVSTLFCGPMANTFWFHVNGPDLGLLVTLPVRVNQMWQHKVCWMINKINWELTVGNFEMDESTGDVRFRCTLPIHGTAPTRDQVFCLFSSAYDAVKKYGLALLENGITDHEPSWLLARAEQDDQDHGAESVL